MSKKGADAIELHIQRYLRNGGTLENLALEYAIKNARHASHSNLVLLKSFAPPKRCVEVLRQGEELDVLTYFPELMARYGPIRADYERPRHITDQKAFAAEALLTRCSPALFAMRAGKQATAREFLGTKAHIAYVLRLLGITQQEGDDE